VSKITLITGGSRSGKSTHALGLAFEHRPRIGRLYFVATAQALDDEMRARIAHHQAARPPEFTTIEEPLDPAATLRSLSDRAAAVVVLDCLTLWISNLLMAEMRDDEVLARAGDLAAVLGQSAFASIVVSGEVGSGIVPDNPLARRFRDLLGRTNQIVGAASDEIILMVAGHPMRVK
jgi:adenosylcobinamide kinase/adenosylcobinamide-phosphate guanylyltransferase